MTSPNTSAATSFFPLSFNPYLDPLLTETLQKWGGGLGSGANLSFSFPWLNGQSAWWQAPTYSAAKEPSAAEHYGFNEVQRSAVINALQEWANVANLRFTEVDDTSTNVGDFRFAFSSALPDSTWGWAVTPNSYWANSGDVWVNSKYGSESNWSSGSYNFEALMHEIGHGLGLKHPGNYGGSLGPYLPSALDDRNHTIMSYTDRNNTYPEAGYVDGVWGWVHYSVRHETPMILDIAAIQYLYGANNTYRTGSDTYTFNSAEPFYQTIWDAGGIDVIDVSNYASGCVIDLTPGHYSSLFIAPASNTGGYTPTYDGTECLGIAYGCLIENVTGGSGDDRFIGNATNNMLDGGAGDDSLTLSGSFNEYQITYQPSTGDIVITDVTTGRDGQDTIRNIEQFVFADGTKALAQLTPDIAPPIAIHFYPTDEATNVAVGSNFMVTFNEAIQRGTGSIILKKADGSVIESFNASTSGNISISGSTLTINPTADLTYGNGYKVEFATGAINDSAGNSYVGTTSYNFTTVAAPGQTFTGTSANELFSGGRGNDTINGGGGTDTAAYSGSRSNYTITKTTTGYTVKDAASVEGTDTLTNIESLQFADHTINLAQMARVFQYFVAYYGRAPALTGEYYWLDNLRGPFANDEKQLVWNFGSATQTEFINLYGSGGTVSNFVAKVYNNLFNRTPLQTGLDYWNGIYNAQKTEGKDDNAIRGEMVTWIMDGATDSVTNKDLTTLNNKVVAASNFTAAVNTPDELVGYRNASNMAALNYAREWLEEITSDSTTLNSHIDATALDQTIVHLVGLYDESVG